MEIIKHDNALKGKNSDKCKTLEYSFNDKAVSYTHLNHTNN